MAQPIVSDVGTVEIGHSCSSSDKVQIIFNIPWQDHHWELPQL